VWTVKDLRPVTVFEVPFEVFRLSVSEDGRVLAVGHYDGAITTWLLSEPDVIPNFLQQYDGHTDNVTCLSIAPQNDLLCSGSRDRLAKCPPARDPNTQRILYEFYVL
jgi:WD40 repeat protein